MSSLRKLTAGPLAGLIIVFLSFMPTQAQTKKVSVVASFSIIGDLVRQVGGDHILLSTIVGPDGDAHVYQPSPQDGRKIARADIIFTNGLGFEGWLSRLMSATNAKGVIITLGAAIKAQQLEGDLDPHAWQNVANAMVYIAEIKKTLIAVDPSNRDAYQRNASAYLEKLAGLDADIERTFAAIPAQRRIVVSTHDAFGYFSARYGVAFLAPQGVSTETEASAKDVARIVAYVKARHARAVFLENGANPQIAKAIAAETGVAIGGTLYSDSLTDEKGDGATYIDMMRHNAREIQRALTM